MISFFFLQFDVIMMDPPWQLATANPTRGVALGYSQLSDQKIAQLPVPDLQSAGLLLIWVINSRYAFALEMFKTWGSVQRLARGAGGLGGTGACPLAFCSPPTCSRRSYTMVDEIDWLKQTVNRRMAKGHGVRWFGSE